MTDLMGAAFALLLIVALAFDNRSFGHIWHDKEDSHHTRRHSR